MIEEVAVKKIQKKEQTVTNVSDLIHQAGKKNEKDKKELDEALDVQVKQKTEKKKTNKEKSQSASESESESESEEHHSKDKHKKSQK